MKFVYSLIFFLLIFQFAISQNFEEKSYAIWISKKDKNWIDSEDDFFIISAEINLANLKAVDLFQLFLGSNIDAQICCGKFTKENTNSELSSEEDLFYQNKNFTFKDDNLTIHILKLKSSTCTCTTNEILKYQGTDSSIKVKFIINYEIKKLSTSEKRKLKKAKRNFRKLLEIKNSV